MMPLLEKIAFTIFPTYICLHLQPPFLKSVCYQLWGAQPGTTNLVIEWRITKK